MMYFFSKAIKRKGVIDVYQANESPIDFNYKVIRSLI